MSHAFFAAVHISFRRHVYRSLKPDVRSTQYYHPPPPPHSPVSPRPLVPLNHKAASKAAWKTKRGFVWPCPRTRQELITHPSKPSESRIDTLREPWIENELNGGGQEATAGASDAGGPSNLAWRKDFDTVPSNGTAVFGGLQVKRDRDLTGSLQV